MTNKIIFMRHGEHISRNGDDGMLCGLTRGGRDEMRSVGKIIETENIVRAYSVENLRSLGSLALAIIPELEDAILENTIFELRSVGRLTIDSDLQYANTVNEEFLQSLNDAFYAGRCLRFHVDESDNYSQKSSDLLSTYSRMASIAANKILTSQQTSLVCAREFFYPSLRSKLTMMKLGEKAFNHYVDYYCSEVELNPVARRQIQVVTRMGSDYKLYDSYGELEFTDEDLLSIKKG
jgi:hypothetical protein